MILAIPLVLGIQGADASPNKTTSWAATDIRLVTRLGLLGRSPVGFDPQAPLTERALAVALDAIDVLQHPTPAPAPAPALAPAPAPAPTPAPAPAPAPAPVLPPPSRPHFQVLSTIPAGATIGGTVAWAITMPDEQIDLVAFAIDGVQQDVERSAPFSFDRARGRLSTAALSDGPHQLAVAVHLAGGITCVAVWDVTVDNAPGSVAIPLLRGPEAVPITHVARPTVVHAALEREAASTRVASVRQLSLYRAVSPSKPVTIRQLDAALVGYLGLGPAASRIQGALAAAGLGPPPDTGTEVVARLLDLRVDHPPAQDDLELLPDQSATRAEAAYSIARLLRLDPSSSKWVQSLADGFTIPALGSWQQRVLSTAVRFIGYPYVWGGTSPTAEAPFGVEAPGGFDCSGFVWRVYKLTPYPGERGLADVLRGRTTYVMSGEVPRTERIAPGKLQPGDVMFFGVGRHSTPSQVDHAALYLGNGWLIQSSDQGVTLAPFSGWYVHSFAWARRPLREAGLE